MVYVRTHVPCVAVVVVGVAAIVVGSWWGAKGKGYMGLSHIGLTVVEEDAQMSPGAAGTAAGAADGAAPAPTGCTSPCTHTMGARTAPLQLCKKFIQQKQRQKQQQPQQ